MCSLVSGALFGVWDASSASVAAYAVTARGAAQPAEKLSTTMTTDPDGKPYAHNAEQAAAHKLARAEGDGPVSNETARAYLAAYPKASAHSVDEEIARQANAGTLDAAMRGRMVLPTTQPTHADIAWYAREVEGLREMLIRADAALETLGVGKLAPVRVNIAHTLYSPNNVIRNPHENPR